MLNFRNCFLLVALTLLGFAAKSAAYVDMAPTLGRIIREARTITLAEVDRFNAEKGAVILKKVRDLKGETSDETLKHELVRPNEPGVSRSILEWAEPGRRCVVFSTGNTVIVCLGEAWYQVNPSAGGWWRIGAPRHDLPLAYYGTVSRLADAVPLIVAGKSAVITTLPHGVGREGASFDLALNRASFPGLVKVQRLHANLRMPTVAMGVGDNPAFVLGMGRADPDDVPVLRKKLSSADASVRAESAEDLGTLGSAASDAVADLTRLLEDESPTVRFAAASALLRIQPKIDRPVRVLADGLQSKDAATRRHAVRAVGLASTAAAPLVGKLGGLVKDPDALVSRMALQAVGTLGPTAADAVDAVTDLLDKPEFAVDAADALGRIGPAARPAVKRLVPLLSAEAATTRWAAVRAMSQIGGPDAAPAVRFLIREMPRASDMDGYNIMIYLALLGPVARDAIPALRTANVRNPVLRQVTAWAIDPGSELPWLGPVGNAEFAQYILEAYVQELGDHLKPAARGLAEKIMAGTAGTVPAWGYTLLARFPDEVLGVLTPGLTHEERVMRERAIVALGHMGRAAAPAKDRVTTALKACRNEREERLLKWCLREID